MARKLPPRTVHLPLGRASVVFEADLGEENGNEILGMAQCVDRKLRLATRLKNVAPAVLWSVFYHEITHMALFDSGVAQMLTREQEEAVCDAVGLAMATMQLAGKGK